MCTPLTYWDRVDGLTLWFQARKAGIDLARAANPGANVYVWDAIELKSFRGVDAEGLRQTECTSFIPPPNTANVTRDLHCMRGADALHGIIPVVQPTYALYSAWDSTALGTVEQDLWDVAAFLYSLNPSSPTKFALGEFGRSGEGPAEPNNFSTRTANLPDPFDAWIYTRGVSAAKRAMIRTGAPPAVLGPVSALLFATLWTAFPLSEDASDSMMTAEGVETTAMRNLQSGISSYGHYSDGTSVLITGVRETNPDRASPIDCVNDGALNPHVVNPVYSPFSRWTFSTTYRSFELYGSYPQYQTSSYSAFSKCYIDWTRTGSQSGCGGCTADSQCPAVFSGNTGKCYNGRCQSIPNMSGAGSPVSSFAFAGSGQINITMPEPKTAGWSTSCTPADMWCVFLLADWTSGQYSDEYGPIRSSGDGPCNPLPH